jgi:indole-3-glycerol phosphate synthase
MLPEILAHKRRELKSVRKRPLADIEREIACLPATRDFETALRESRNVSLIAEIKRRSPSKGSLSSQLEPAATARLYESAGASAVSVLTDSHYFDGSESDLIAARECTALPVLRKDFIVDEYQVLQSRLMGADAILLIVAALSPEELVGLSRLAADVGLYVLTEVHDENEIGIAMKAGSGIIGINNRNLKTFEVSLSTTEKLRPLIPSGIVCVSESGIKNREDVLRVQVAGVNAVLVGEGIVTAEDPVVQIKTLLGAQS